VRAPGKIRQKKKGASIAGLFCVRRRLEQAVKNKWSK
jgi:hypothetical protein